MSNLVGRKVRVVREIGDESPLVDNDWKIGDKGTIQMVLKDPEYNIIVHRGDDVHDTLGFSIEELEFIDE